MAWSQPSRWAAEALLLLLLAEGAAAAAAAAAMLRARWLRACRSISGDGDAPAAAPRTAPVSAAVGGRASIGRGVLTGMRGCVSGEVGEEERALVIDSGCDWGGAGVSFVRRARERRRDWWWW